MINNKSILFAFVLLIASSLFWSGNFFTGKIASLYDLTPFKLSFLRWLLAFLLLLPFTFRRIILDFNKYKKNLQYLIITSILGVTIFNSFTYLSLQTSMVINSSIMASITPLLIIFFSWLIFKTQTYFMQFFGIILSIIGVLLIISKANLNNLINLNVSQNTALTDLNCYDNNISILDLNNNTSLTDLLCRINNLSSFRELNSSFFCIFEMIFIHFCC